VEDRESGCTEKSELSGDGVTRDCEESRDKILVDEDNEGGMGVPFTISVLRRASLGVSALVGAQVLSPRWRDGTAGATAAAAAAAAAGGATAALVFVEIAVRAVVLRGVMVLLGVIIVRPFSGLLPGGAVG
jgi:hypothetical protein